MKWNPVFRRDIRIQSRSVRTAVILVLFNFILSCVVLYNMFVVISQARQTAQIDYTRFMELYTAVSLVEFLMLLFITPTLTAAAISGEKERRTFDLLLTTAMEPGEIVRGKLYSALAALLIIVISALPVQSVVFVYGGISALDMAEVVFCFGVVAAFAGAVGVFCSAFSRRTAFSTTAAYILTLLLTAGTAVVPAFFTRGGVRIFLEGRIPGLGAGGTGTGNLIYFLLANPLISFYSVINGQLGHGTQREILSSLYGPVPASQVIDWWVPLSFLVQLLVTGILIAAAAGKIRPARGRKRGAGMREAPAGEDGGRPDGDGSPGEDSPDIADRPEE